MYLYIDWNFNFLNINTINKIIGYVVEFFIRHFSVILEDIALLFLKIKQANHSSNSWTLSKFLQYGRQLFKRKTCCKFEFFTKVLEFLSLKITYFVHCNYAELCIFVLWKEFIIPENLFVVLQFFTECCLLFRCLLIVCLA